MHQVMARISLGMVVHKQEEAYSADSHLILMINTQRAHLMDTRFKIRCASLQIAESASLSSRLTIHVIL